MNQKTEELLERTFNFGVDCILFLETIPDDKILGVVKIQLAKAALLLVQIMKNLKVQNQIKILFIKSVLFQKKHAKVIIGLEY